MLGKEHKKERKRKPFSPDIVGYPIFASAYNSIYLFHIIFFLTWYGSVGEDGIMDEYQ